MKKQYNKAEIEIVFVYENNDVLNASGNVGNANAIDVFEWFNGAEDFQQ